MLRARPSPVSTIPFCALVCCTDPGTTAQGGAAPPTSSVAMTIDSAAPVATASASATAAPSAAPPADPPLSPERSAALPEDLRSWVSGIAVSGRGIARRDFLSWTTATQAAALRDGGQVLVREVSPAYGPCAFDYRVDADAEKGDEIAKLLLHAAFAKKRFAWSAAFATLRGGGGGPYGDVLLAVRLREDAFILDYTARRLYLASGSEIPIAELTAKPERLGAVYWDAERFREYVLVNEAAIEQVTSNTPELAERTREEQRRLTELAALLEKTPAAERAPILDALVPATAFAPMKLGDVVELAGSVKLAAKPGPAIDRAITATFALGAPRPPRPAACAFRAEVPNDITHGYGTFKVCSPQSTCEVVKGKCQLTQRSVIVLTGDR